MEDRLNALRPWLRGLPIIIAAMVIGVLVAKKYLSYVTPMYESTVKLKLADSKEGVPDANLFKDLDVFTTSNKIGAEIEVMKSQVLLNKVFDQLDFDLELYRVGQIRSVELYQNAPITVQYSGLTEKAYDKDFDLQVLDDTHYTVQMAGMQAPVSGKMGVELTTPYAVFTIALNDSLLQKNPELQVVDHYKFRINSRQKLFNQILKNIDIVAVDKDVAVLRLSYKSPNPVKAAVFINKLAEAYIQDYIETKYKAAHVTVNFLDDQIEGVVAKLSGAENQIQAYRDEEGITNIRQETETDLRKISQLKIQQTNIRMNLEAIQDLERYVQNGQGRFLELAPNFEAFTDLLSTEMVKKIKALQSEKKDLLLVYTPEDDRVKVIDAKIADLTQYLTESITNTRKNLEVKARNLNNDIEAAEAVFIGVPEKEKMLNILDREFNIYEQSYNFLNAKKIEAEIAQAAKIAFHRIITPAQIASEPVSPNRAIITILGALLSMFGAIFLIFMVHLMKAKVNDIQTIESNSVIPVAMLTPKLKSAEAVEKHFLKEAIQLELKGLMTPGSVVCFSSYRQSEGAAYNILQLSRALALQDRKVLLVDVQNQFQLPVRSDVTPGNLQKNVDYITLTDPRFSRSTVASMKTFLEGFQKEYDFILVLNEALNHKTIALLLMSVADVNLVVMDTRLTPRKRVMETNLLKAEFNLPNTFFLINRYAYYPGVVQELMQFVKRMLTQKQKRHAFTIAP